MKNPFLVEPTSLAAQIADDVMAHILKRLQFAVPFAEVPAIHALVQKRLSQANPPQVEPMSAGESPSASDQLRHEIHNTISRMGQESGITVYQTIGVLEVVKADMIELLTRERE